MKSMKFKYLFLVAAWIAFIASGRNTYASILMICAGAYLMADVIPEIRRYMKNAKR